MNGFKESPLDATSIKQAAKNQIKRYVLATGTAIVGLIFILTAYAQDRGPLTFSLTQPSDKVAGCLNATARVTVFPREDIRGVDTLDLKAEGLPPNTTFAVFLTESPVPPVGAVQYIADFTTNAEGRGSVRVDAIIEEAFALGRDGVHRDLNHIVIWFADPQPEDSCVGNGKTVFDGDGEAGVAVLSSRNALPGAPLP